jgi:Domain of unknown function (DUF4157)
MTVRVAPTGQARRGVLQRCGGHPCPPAGCRRPTDDARLLRAPATGGPSLSAVPPLVAEVLGSPGRPLDTTTRAVMEARLGHDFAGVRVHTDQRASESARAVNAVAYTVGSDLVFAACRYAPTSTEGERLLAHELIHVVQQSSTPAPAAGVGLLASGDMVVSDPSDEAEREATAVSSAMGPPGARRTWAGPRARADRLRAVVQRMAACPAALSSSAAPPAGWKPYHGDSNWFHCGFRGILEDRHPTPQNPQNECFYDQHGALVDEHHKDAGCRGTPNQYDSATDPIKHALIDTGGIVQQGPGAFVAARRHDVREAVKPVMCSNLCRFVPHPGCMIQCLNQ